MCQELLDLGTPERSRRLALVKLDIATYPLQVGLFRAQSQVARAHLLARHGKQSALSPHRGLPSRRPVGLRPPADGIRSPNAGRGAYLTCLGYFATPIRSSTYS